MPGPQGFHLLECQLRLSPIRVDLILRPMLTTRAFQHVYGPTACSLQNTFHSICGPYEGPTRSPSGLDHPVPELWNYCQKAFAVMIQSSILTDHLRCFSLRYTGILISGSLVYQRVHTQIYNTMRNSSHFGKKWTRSYVEQRRNTCIKNPA